MEDVRKTVIGEYEARLEEMGAMDLGSDEYKAAVETEMKLVDRITKLEELKLEREMREKQLRAENWDKVAKHAIDVGKWAGGIAAGYVIYVGAMYFEEHGRIPTTPAGRKIIDTFFKNFKF